MKGLDEIQVQKALEKAIMDKPLCHEARIRQNSANRSMRCIGG